VDLYSAVINVDSILVWFIVSAFIHSTSAKQGWKIGSKT